MTTSAVYLDCNATTPIEHRVAETINYYLLEEYGNAASHTHEFGSRAKEAVEKARRSVSQVVQCDPSEVIFTSGATESNNLAILGLREYGKAEDKTHIIVSSIEHKAVLDPAKCLEQDGFKITRIPCSANGRIKAEDILSEITSETLLVSLMHVNNETGVIQPIEEIAEALQQSDVYLHTDAAQSFGRELKVLRHPRLDLISISGHKIFGPKGVGALIIRRRNYRLPSLKPLIYGGGQERGFRSGTLPVHLIAGLGSASEIALSDHRKRWQKCLEFKDKLLSSVNHLNPTVIGDMNYSLPSTVSLVFPGMDSEALILGLKEYVAISNGSACTSDKHEPSHVLTAMGLPPEYVNGAARFSWCHLTPEVDFEHLADAISKLQ